MKTIKNTGPLFYSCETDKTKGVPPGLVRVHVVRYETYEMTSEEFDACSFTIHDANCKEARTIAALVKS